MSRIFITLAPDGEKIPFLRGILTRSLHDAGLSFEQAYKKATEIRDSLKHGQEISAVALRQRVCAELEKMGPEFAQRYKDTAASTPLIMLKDKKGNLEPFSRGELRVRLEACDLSLEKATAIASKIHDQLVASGLGVYEIDFVKNMIVKTLETEAGNKPAQNFRTWDQFYESHQPVIILIGGAAGTGKSTLSGEIAHRMQIGRSQSTDLLREVLRSILPKGLLPTLHESSFLAWKSLPELGQSHGKAEDLMIQGYLAQVELLKTSCLATIRRALKENVSLILEGVHILPSFFQEIKLPSDPIVIPMMLGVLSKKKLKKRIWVREEETPNRRARRYLNNFEAIWEQQSFLLAEADRLDVPIISNMEKERAIRQAMSCILSAISKRNEKKGLKA